MFLQESSKLAFRLFALVSIATAVLLPGTSESWAALTCSAGVIYSKPNGTEIYQTNVSTGAQTLVGNFTYPVAGITNINPFGISPDGNWGYSAVGPVQPAVGSQKGRVLIWNANTGTTTYSTSASPTLAASTTGQFVAGSVNPVTGIFYFAAQNTTAPATGWDVYGYNRVAGGDPFLVARISGIIGANADMAFDATGSLYFVSDGLFRVGSVPSTAGTGTIAATQIGGLFGGATSAAAAFDGNDVVIVRAAGISRYNASTGALISTSPAPSAGAASDAASCTFPNTIRLAKNLPNGRIAATDQFTLTITGGTISSGNTATTTGVATGVQAAVAGPVFGLVGVTYTVTESASGTTNLANYSSTWSCVNTSASNAVIATGNGITGSFVLPATSGGGTDVLCTFTNLPRFSVSLTKVWTNGAAGNAVGLTITGGTSATAGTSTAGGATTAATASGAAGTTITLAENFTDGAAGSYRITVACTRVVGGGAVAVTQVTVTSHTFVMPNDSGVNCTYTNARPTLTLQKAWANARLNDAITFTATGLTSLNAVANAATETDSGAAQAVNVGASIALAETFTTGTQANYNSALACTGNATPLAGSTLTVNTADTTITCTWTNTRRQSNLQTVKTRTTLSPALTGSTVTFTIVVTNNGPDAATNVALADVVPAGLTVTSVNTPPPTAGSASNTGNNVSWSIPTLANAASATLTISATIN